MQLKRSIFLSLIILIIFILLALLWPEEINDKKIFMKTKETSQKIKIRPAYVAGEFYPAQKEKLESAIENFLNNVWGSDPQTLEIKALIAPHAGYIFSGQIAAMGYKQLENHFNKVFILADNHNSQAFYSGVSVPTNFTPLNKTVKVNENKFAKDLTGFTHFQTPLGEIKISNLINSFLTNKLFQNILEAHESHVIEIHLPFLQKILKNFEIIPMVLSGLDKSQRKELANLISQNLDSNTLIIASSDLSHFHSYDEAVKLDKTCLKAITDGDIEKSEKCEICGPSSVLTLMEIAKQRQWKSKLLDYKNSGDIFGDKNSVVGYGSVIFYQEKDLNKKEQQMLLGLARKSIESRVKNKINSAGANNHLPLQNYPKLLEKKGAFVTLYKNGKLRGCIGSILPTEELYLSVQNNAINAAIHDPRFAPVTPEELNEIDIEISVLEIPQLIIAKNWQEYLDQLTPLKDGVIIKLGSNQATYLPQVWEQISDKKIFLNSLCQKAGLDYECWKNPQIEIYKYRVQLFKE